MYYLLILVSCIKVYLDPQSSILFYKLLIVKYMLRKLDFSLCLFEILEVSNNSGIEALTLDNFSNYVFGLYDIKILYDFQLGVTYNIHLVDVYDQVFGVVPFKLESLMDNEDLIGNCYFDVCSELEKFLDKSEYDGFLVIYISKDIVGEINYKEIFKCIEDSGEELKKLDNDLDMLK